MGWQRTQYAQDSTIDFCTLDAGLSFPFARLAPEPFATTLGVYGTAGVAIAPPGATWQGSALADSTPLFVASAGLEIRPLHSFGDVWGEMSLRAGARILSGFHSDATDIPFIASGGIELAIGLGGGRGPNLPGGEPFEDLRSVIRRHLREFVLTGDIDEYSSVPICPAVFPARSLSDWGPLEIRTSDHCTSEDVARMTADVAPGTCALWTTQAAHPGNDIDLRVRKDEFIGRDEASDDWPTAIFCNPSDSAVNVTLDSRWIQRRGSDPNGGAAAIARVDFPITPNFPAPHSDEDRVDVSGRCGASLSPRSPCLTEIDADGGEIARLTYPGRLCFAAPDFASSAIDVTDAHGRATHLAARSMREWSCADLNSTALPYTVSASPVVEGQLTVPLILRYDPVDQSALRNAARQVFARDPSGWAPTEEPQVVTLAAAGQPVSHALRPFEIATVRVLTAPRSLEPEIADHHGPATSMSDGDYRQWVIGPLDANVSDTTLTIPAQPQDAPAGFAAISWSIDSPRWVFHDTLRSLPAAPATVASAAPASGTASSAPPSSGTSAASSAVPSAAPASGTPATVASTAPTATSAAPADTRRRLSRCASGFPAEESLCWAEAGSELNVSRGAVVCLASEQDIVVVRRVPVPVPRARPDHMRDVVGCFEAVSANETLRFSGPALVYRIHP